MAKDAPSGGGRGGCPRWRAVDRTAPGQGSWGGCSWLCWLRRVDLSSLMAKTGVAGASVESDLGAMADAPVDGLGQSLVFTNSHHNGRTATHSYAHAAANSSSYAHAASANTSYAHASLVSRASIC